MCVEVIFFPSELQRKAKGNQESINEIDLPNLWILATSASEKLINSFCFQLDRENWVKGVYISPVGWKTNLIAINQLPIIPETLWLRILGKGKTQKNMTKQPHDQFAKQYLKELLSPFGEVEISREVTGEVRQIDIYFLLFQNLLILT